MTNLPLSDQKIHEILSGLDDDQRCAACAVRGPVRILAGAGAGKTRTITHRIAYACATKTWNPHRVLAVTFSVKAAREMQERMNTLGVSGVQVNTFHAMALKQLRWIWNNVTDGAPFPQILDNMHEFVGSIVAMIIQRNVQTYPELATIQQTQQYIQDIVQEISWTKVSLISSQEYSSLCDRAGHTPPCDLPVEVMQQIIEQYEYAKSVRNRIDFNDILLLVTQLIEEYPDIAREVRRDIEAITVDEYQDVSPLQYRLLRAWLGNNTNICVVGDPGQTIYSFAGATSYYLTNFEHEFEQAQTFTLATDYRSTPEIVRYANQILHYSPYEQGYLHLRSPRRHGTPVYRHVAMNDIEEAQAVAEHIQGLIAHGVQPKDIAVLFRINAQAKIIAQQLQLLRVPYTIVGNAFHNDMLSNINAIAQESLADLENNRAEVLDEPLSRANTSASGDIPTDDHDAASDMRAMSRRLSDTLSRGTVQLLTIHQSKGLEWKHVFVVGVSEGYLPYGRAQQVDAFAVEEERRLLYVAVTRAQDTIMLSHASFRDNRSEGRARQESPFIHKLNHLTVLR